jgi:hypothetical protein
MASSRKCTTKSCQHPASNILVSSAQCTHNSHGPHNAVEYQEPGLFTEPRDALPLCHPACLGNRSEYVFHDTRSQTSEEHDAKNDEERIILSKTVETVAGVLVRKRKEFGGVYAERGEEEVCKSEEGAKVERDTWESPVSKEGMVLEVIFGHGKVSPDWLSTSHRVNCFMGVSPFLLIRRTSTTLSEAWR